jgi:hypothetical protein
MSLYILGSGVLALYPDPWNLKPGSGFPHRQGDQERSLALKPNLWTLKSRSSGVPHLRTQPLVLVSRSCQSCCDAAAVR